MDQKREEKPLIYSCSGCSSAAQMANALAVRADRAGLAEMSCIAGIGGDVPQLVRVAQSGRPMLVLDGCELNCARRCLARQGLEPDAHLVLTKIGVRKIQHKDFCPEQAEKIFEEVTRSLHALRPSE